MAQQSLFGPSPEEIMQARAVADDALAQQQISSARPGSGLMGLATQAGRMGGRWAGGAFGAGDPELDRASRMQAAQNRAMEVGYDPTDPSSSLPIMIQAMQEQGLTAEAFKLAEQYRGVRREDRQEERAVNADRRQEEQLANQITESENRVKLANDLAQRQAATHTRSMQTIEEQITAAQSEGLLDRVAGLQRQRDQEVSKHKGEMDRLAAQTAQAQAAANRSRSVGALAAGKDITGIKHGSNPDGSTFSTYFEKENGKWVQKRINYDAEGNVIEKQEGAADEAGEKLPAGVSAVNLKVSAERKAELAAEAAKAKDVAARSVTPEGSVASRFLSSVFGKPKQAPVTGQIPQSRRPYERN